MEGSAAVPLLRGLGAAPQGVRGRSVLQGGRKREEEQVVSDSEVSEVSDGKQHTGVVIDQLEQLVVRSVYAEMVGRPVDQVYRVLVARLGAADVVLPSERIWEHADSISDGTFELLR
jgi:hypothetical protein